MSNQPIDMVPLKQFLRPLTFCGLAISFLFAPSTIIAQSYDWPQINGPARNGIANKKEKLLTQWPKVLNRVWSHPVGQGYAGPVVVGNTVIIFHRPGKQYLVEALNTADGKVIWNQKLDANYQAQGPDPDTGPKAIPIVHKEHIYLYGTGGTLFCLELKGGKVVWQKNVAQQYGSPLGYFGAGSTPIIIGDNLIVNVGGREAGIVAFDLKTGKENWKAVNDRASYSSPTQFTKHGRTIAVFVTRLNLVGLDAKTGDVVFKTPFGARGTTVNAAMPIVLGSHIFVNAAYNIGAKYVDISGDTLKVVWANRESYASQYATPVVFKERLYGSVGREDIGNGAFRCIDPTDGKVQWEKKRFPVCHSILVEDQILCTDSKGGLHVIQANEKAFKELYSGKLFERPSRSMPALSNGFLFARSNASPRTGELVCVEVGQHAASQK